MPECCAWSGRPVAFERIAETAALQHGHGNYSSPTINLTYAKPDARRLGAALEARGTSYYAGQNVELLLDSGATRRLISAALEKTRPEDTVLFYFAGHGVQGSDRRYYLTPSDLDLNNNKQTGPPWPEIAAILEKTKARAVVILDSCHSGLFPVPARRYSCWLHRRGREFSFEGRSPLL